MKQIVIVLLMSFSALAITGAQATEKPKHTFSKSAKHDHHRGDRREHREHRRHHRDERYDRHDRRRHYRNHRGRGHSDYLIGGLLLGTLTQHHYSNHNHHSRHCHHRSHRRLYRNDDYYYPTYMRDRYGDCYKLKRRHGRDSYVQVRRRYCRSDW